ncbi:pre-mRNA-splicing factor Syf2-like isoform X1 [Macrobrachium nipponense]|uniref:pre-mRNA-splicing factor Syf2-like isoform X1 n=2 Tax=Macrobrachium nipponense TaxID=159736 RepID=UPI0030C8432B
MTEAVASSSKMDKLAEFKARLAKLHTKRNEAAALNHKEVVEEDRLKQMPKNHLKKRERLEAEFREEKRKEAVIAEGKDYDRVRMLEVGADEAEQYERKKRKKNPDLGFSTYEDATIRQYNRLVKNKKVDLEEYEREKAAVGEDAFYGRDNTIAIGLHKDTPDAIDNMVNDLEKQIAKREKYSRRRIFDDDDDINFINERNMKFNKKLERFYGNYTEEIKQNLERGTAV